MCDGLRAAGAEDGEMGRLIFPKKACPIDVAIRTSSTAMAKCRRSLCTRSSLDMRNFKH